MSPHVTPTSIISCNRLLQPTPPTIRTCGATTPRREALPSQHTVPLLGSKGTPTMYLALSAMGHGPLGDLDQHGEDGLLEGEAEVGLGALPALDSGARLLLDEAQQTRERHIHACVVTTTQVIDHDRGLVLMVKGRWRCWIHPDL
jgi:hypothetical protein